MEYKCLRNDKTLIKGDTHFPSSKLCSECKTKNDIGSLEFHQCPSCRTIHNRDENAAKNLNIISTFFLDNGITITTEKEFLQL